MSPKQTLRRAQQKVNQARRSKTLASVAKAAEKRSGRQGPAVFGPYPNRGKWRLVLVDDSGRQARVFSTRAEAEEIKARVLEDERSRQTKTIGESIAEYEDYRLKYRGVKLLTAENETFYLRDLLPIDAPLASLTTEKAARIYSDCVQRPNRRTGKPLSPNTHHWLLLITKCWAKWCVKSKLLSTNPFAAVEPIGKGGVGKQQLRIEEAQRLDRHLVQRAEHGDTAAIGVLLMLHLGLRQGEVTARVARDVDADCRILHIPFGKTHNAQRRLRIPEWLRPLLRALVATKKPNQLLFSSSEKLRRVNYWWRKVHEFCEQAGVPLVCPHSLRGLHATLAIEEGATSESVARALGHTSFAVTAKHYASADSVANARVNRASHVLLGYEPTRSTSEDDPVAALLSQLTPDQLTELHRRLIQQPAADSAQYPAITSSPIVPQ